MNGHDRFNEDHRRICDDCYNAYLDFKDEQAEEAYLDAMAEADDED